MRRQLISVASVLAVAGAAAIATAQDDKGKAPEQQTPGAAKAERQREPDRQAPPKATQQRATPDKDQPKAAGQPQPGNQPKSTEQRPIPDKDQPKAAEQPRPGKDQPKSTEQRPTPDKNQPKAAEQPGSSKSAGSDKQPGERLKVSEEQRSGVRERLVKETRVEKTRINVSVNIGTSIPRSVRLHTLPVGIVAIAPVYRGYHYVVLEDETILIVDPRTYVVVDVIAVDGRRAGEPGHARLALSTAERRFLFTSLPRHRTADVRVRLALGAQVPGNVELLAFPGEVVARVPQIQRYRYVVSEGDIVIVDPNDHGVVLVVSD